MRKRLVRAAKVGVVLLGFLAVSFGVLMSVTFWGIVDPVDGAVVGSGVAIDDGNVFCHYIDAGDDAIVLIDACVSEDAGAIREALSNAGFSASSVTAILLTHGHADHRGGVGRFPNARVFAHRDELPLLRGDSRSRGPIPWMSGYAEPLDVIAVDDGEVVDLGAISARAFHLPGHTPGSVAWLVDDTLFIGDAAASRDAERVSGAPWVFSDDVEEGDRSLAALAPRLSEEGLTVDWLVFSHSAPLRGMEPLREFARQRGR
jgi:glyoxylase-like metal-dependent hydrolase (beta-lactamase superfamily II)